MVRVGLIQNSTVLPTTAHFSEQKQAIFQKVKPMIEAAGMSGVNILCLQVIGFLGFKFFIHSVVAVLYSKVNFIVFS